MYCEEKVLKTVLLWTDEIQWMKVNIKREEDSKINANLTIYIQERDLNR